MSKFVVSARKYRPNRFDDVVGQGHVSQTLKNALQNDHLAHAFLFCGPRGVGKTTCARILAKVLNCQNRTADFEPCNTCDSCESFNGNASFNITELDAASNNSVDHIRSLVEQVRFQPQQGEYKVFIIDEVHMLSASAFNAFLKTLEEPPSYAIFILATTEKHKIIPTILSRCQIFDFRRIQVADTVTYLQEICVKEGIKAEPDALHIIAQKADGALRDALSIFDRIVSFSGKSISYDDVIENLNILDYDYFFKIVDALLMSDISNVLLIFNDILKKGFDPDIFINGLAEHIRNLLVSKDEKTLSLLEVSPALQQKYLEQSKAAPASFLLSALSLANDCDVNFKMARNKRLHTEMAIIKMAHISQAVDLSKQPIQIAEKKTPLSTQSSSATPVIATKPKPTPPVVQKTATEPTPAAPIVAQTPVTEAILPVVPVSEPVPLPTAEKTNPNPPIVSEPQPEIPQETNPNPVKKGGLAARLKNKTQQITPNISIGNIEQQISDEANRVGQEQVDLSLENIQGFWNEYIKTVTSNTVRITMQQADLELKEESIFVTIGSKRSEGHIREENELMPFLREKLQNKRISLSYVIDSAKSLINTAPPKPKVFTSKEKFNLMKDQNPLVEKIYNRFGLRLEE